MKRPVSYIKKPVAENKARLAHPPSSCCPPLRPPPPLPPHLLLLLLLLLLLSSLLSFFCSPLVHLLSSSSSSCPLIFLLLFSFSSVSVCIFSSSPSSSLLFPLFLLLLPLPLPPPLVPLPSSFLLLCFGRGGGGFTQKVWQRHFGVPTLFVSAPSPLLSCRVGAEQTTRTKTQTKIPNRGLNSEMIPIFWKGGHVLFLNVKITWLNAVWLNNCFYPGRYACVRVTRLRGCTARACTKCVDCTRRFERQRSQRPQRWWWQLRAALAT